MKWNSTTAQAIRLLSGLLLASVTLDASALAKEKEWTSAQYREAIAGKTYLLGQRSLYLDTSGTGYEIGFRYTPSLSAGKNRSEYAIRAFRWSVRGVLGPKVCRSASNNNIICYRPSDFLRLGGTAGDVFNMKSMQISPALKRYLGR